MLAACVLRSFLPVALALAISSRHDCIDVVDDSSVRVKGVIIPATILTDITIEIVFGP